MITVDKPTVRKPDALLSVVIPVYQEGSHIGNSIRTIENVLKDNRIVYEFILVDDGSTDNTWNELKKSAYGNDKISIIRLSRNFGKESALCAGLEYAGGEMGLVMDGDLQHPPEIIPDMVSIWLNEGYDVVEGIKHSRGKENIIYRLCAKFFYLLIYKSSDINLGKASDFKLMDRKVVEAWKTLPERAIFFRGMSAWLGFSRKEIKFDVAKRVNGKTKWSLFRLIRLAVNAITSYTSMHALHYLTRSHNVFRSIIDGNSDLIYEIIRKSQRWFYHGDFTSTNHWQCNYDQLRYYWHISY